MAPDRSLAALASNALRNLSMEWGTPLPSVNTRIERVLISGANLLHLNLDQASNKEDPTAPWALNTQITNHDMASAPLTMLVLVCASAVVLVGAVRRFRAKEYAALLPAVYLAGGLIGLLSIAALVTWQPYITRTFTGSVLLLTPLAGLASDKLASMDGLPQRGVRIAARILLAGLV
jgi:hypothetical protein